MKLQAVQYRNQQSNPNVEVNDLPDRCPQCHETGSQVFLGPAWFINKDQDEIVLAIRCPSHKCNQVYFAAYRVESLNGVAPPTTGIHARLERCFPVKPRGYHADAIIDSISKRFRAIATEAKNAEMHGLLEVCGPGYRKALEFLVKDYLIHHIFKSDEAKQALIRRILLADAIANHIPDNKVKALAARCAWLGNDETHYERVHDQHDLQDLKNLLALTVAFIAQDLHADKYLSEVQKPKGAAR